MSTERDIEKLLREAARQRLEKAGAPIELHPANRRALQEAVARQFGGKNVAPRPSFLLWLGRAWPRLAVGFGLVIVLGLAATFWIQRESSPRVNNQTVAVAESRKSPEAVSGTFDRPAKDVISELAQADNKAAVDRSSAEVETFRARTPVAATASAAPGNAAPSLAPRAAAPSPPLVANGPATQPSAPPAALTLGEAPKSAASSQVLMRSAERQALVQTAGGKQANAAGRGLAGAAATDGSASAPVVSQSLAIHQHFVQETTQTITKSVDALGDRAAVPILRTFDLRVNDGQLTITDDDGSVYTGNLLPMPAQTDNVLKWKADLKEEAPTTINGASTVPRIASKQANPTADGAVVQVVPDPTNLLFQVSGTNTSLNQLVVFKGSLILTPAPRLARQSTNLASDKVAQYGFAAPAAPVLQTNFQVIGRAQLGSNAPIDVNARPASQGR